MKQVAWGYVPNDGKILIATRIKKDDPLRSGEFVLPGGGLEQGEDYVAAAIREVKEETDIDAFYKADFYFKPEEREYSLPNLDAFVDRNGLINLRYLDSGKEYQGRLIGLRPTYPDQLSRDMPQSDARDARFAHRSYIDANMDSFTPAAQVLIKIIKDTGV